MKDYMVYCEDTLVPEKVLKTKTQAIKAAKAMAKKYGCEAIILPCTDCEPDDLGALGSTN